MQTVTLIACGPTAQKIYLFPEQAEGSIAVVNKAGVTWEGHIDYWFSLHTEHFSSWIKSRLELGKSMEGIRCICPDHRGKPKGVEFIPRKWPRLGSSSYYAVEMLETLGYELCHMYGVDLKSRAYKHYARYWKKPEDMKIKLTGRNF